MKRQFIESMKRLYQSGKVTKEKIVELCVSGKITAQEKLYILEVKPK